MAEKIEKGSRRATAQPYLEHMAAEGLSANEALGRLRELGLGYRRTTFLDDYRKYTGKEKAKDVAKYIRHDYYPTMATMSSDNRYWRKKYNDLISYTVENIATGETETKRMYISHDEVYTVGQSIDAAMDYINEHLDEYGYRFKNIGYRGTVLGGA